MLQLGNNNKRLFDSLHTPPTYFADTFDSSNQKKRRTNQFQTPLSPQTTKKFIDETDFTTGWSIHSVDEDTFLKWVPKRKRAKYQASTKQDPIFSTNDTKAIVATAIEETRKILEDEYNRVFETKIKEQLEVLSKVVNDNVTRQLEQSSHDYMV